jgi:hypothetical protein
MGIIIDIAGNKYGRLTAEAYNSSGEWWFICDCGIRKSIKSYSVKSGLVRSCGCMHLDRCKSGLNALRHGDARKGKVTRLHNIWRKIKERCMPQGEYGKLGIGCCQEWQAYEPFRDWSYANGYSDRLTIDRIDNNRGYSPDNCRWSSCKEQARNRRTSRLFTMNGKTQTVAAWIEETGMPRHKFRAFMKEHERADHFELA